MKKQIILFLLSAVIIHNNLNADMLQEIAKRDRQNPIRLVNSSYYSPYVLYAKDGYLQTEYWEDGMDEPSIVAYKIQEDSVNLIIRIKTWDFAFRIYDYLYDRDGIDLITVDAHDYYHVELVNVNGRLETYCNRLRDINTNGYIYNDAKINANINKVSYYYYTFPRLDTNLTEGMKTKIVELTNVRTNELAENTYTFEAYDYYYNVLIDGRQVRINGYLLDFANKIDYRAGL